jgi:hypothetical protein
MFSLLISINVVLNRFAGGSIGKNQLLQMKIIKHNMVKLTNLISYGVILIFLCPFIKLYNMYTCLSSSGTDGDGDSCSSACFYQGSFYWFWQRFFHNGMVGRLIICSNYIFFTQTV